MFIVSIITPMTIGYNIKTNNVELTAEKYNFNSCLFSEYYNCYNASNTVSYGPIPGYEYNDFIDIELEKVDILKDNSKPLDGPPMDSPWPMYCHDTRHTGRSPYSTVNNTGNEIWWIKLYAFIEGSAVIDNNNILFFGSWTDRFYAVDLNNKSVIWNYHIGGNVESSPAIDKNSTIYVGTAYGIEGNFLYALTTNGSLKWKYKTGDNIFGSPVIGDDGSIYFGYGGGPPSGYVIALYPNGTLKWRFNTGHAVFSAPAIGSDGTIYCGSHNGYLYALDPDNGTIKWEYKTNDWVGNGPCIGEDGIIYFGSWDGCLYACYTNGTLKWKTGNIGVNTNPVISEEGIIYVGQNYLTAVYSNNGTVKWRYDVPGRVSSFSTPCISADGTIYCGTADNGYIVALNPDGTLLWRQYLGGECFFSPIIGPDGNVYVGSNRDQDLGGGHLILTGYLHVYGKLNPNAPSTPIIQGPVSGKKGENYDFTIMSSSPIGNDLYYWIEWGDLYINEWIGPYKSGETIEISHSWRQDNDYTIRVKVKDSDDIWGPWGEFDIIIPRNKPFFNSLLIRIIEQFTFFLK